MYHSDNSNGTFTNPVLFVDYPDPDIIRVGEDFYMVSSSFTDAPGIPICHSRDLVNWTVIGHVYDRIPDPNHRYSMAGGEVMYRGGSWAPSLRYHKGKFYCCFCTPAEGFYMAIAEAPQGPYELTHFGGVELYDPGLFFDDDDRVYVIHGANDLYLNELTPDAKALKGESIHLYTTAYGNPLEGSHVYKTRGYYYICNTCRGYNGIQIVFRSRTLTGPYESRLICADDMNYAGAGMHQGGFVDLANGETWFFLFQDRDYVGRVPILQPVTWVEDWPVIGDKTNYGKVAVTLSKPSIPGEHPLCPPATPEEFDAGKLHRKWQWNHNPDESRWSLTERPGWLRLKASTASELMKAGNTLTQKIIGPASTAVTKIDLSGLKPGDVAGIALIGFPHGYLAIHQELSGKSLIMVNDGNEIERRSLDQALLQDSVVYLQARVDVEGMATFAYAVRENTPFSNMGERVRLQFSVKSFLGNKFGLFCFNTSNSGQFGHADFDYLHFEEESRALGHFQVGEEISASRYDVERGIDTQRPVEKMPHSYVVNIHDGDWLRFNHLDFRSGANRFKVRASPSGAGGVIELRLGSLDGELIGTCRIPGNGERGQSTKNWQMFETTITPVQGVQSLVLKFCGGPGYFVCLDFFQFEP